MPVRVIHWLLMSVMVIILLLVQVQHAEAAAYVTEYVYDAAGNLVERRMVLDQTPPITTAVPPGGFFNNPQSVTLTCNDGTGAGCDKIYYTTDGTTPTTSSPVYSSPINISVDTPLKFFATDQGGNSETVKTGRPILAIAQPRRSYALFLISPGHWIGLFRFRFMNGNANPWSLMMKPRATPRQLLMRMSWRRKGKNLQPRNRSCRSFRQNVLG
ncbi:MAG: chitobiase/beta-hexosaminidase C-terminal domain-containing protein [Thermodesulfobacteriota bacterium]